MLATLRAHLDWPRSRLGWNWLLARYYAAGAEHLTGALYEALADTLRSRLFAGLPPGGVVLDAGCGTGHTMSRVARDAGQATVLGVDFSSTMVALAARTVGLAGSARCRVAQGDVAHLPLRDASVDLVLSFLSLKWWRDPEECLRELRRVTRDGGHVVLVEMNPEAGHEERDAWKRRIVLALRPPLRRARLRTFERAALPESLSAARVAALARTAGFADLDVATVPGLPFLRAIMSRRSA